MNAGGDAAEQVVRMSLEGVEVAAKITGSGVKHLAVLVAAVLKEEQKTHGKARLTNMIKSGHELKVFTVQQKDLKTFAKEAKRYGVLYSVLREKKNDDPTATVDVIARAADAPKISRIVERFKLNTVDKASVIRTMEQELKENPIFAKTEKSPQSLQRSGKENVFPMGKPEKTSVREELMKYRAETKKKNEISPRDAIRKSPAKKKKVKER